MTGLPATPAAVIEQRYGSRVRISDSFGQAVADVSPDDWLDVLAFSRSVGFEFFDWLTGVDEPPDGFSVVAHVFNPVALEHLLVRTRVPRADPVLPSVTGIFRGANWHERETYEMFGIVFDGHPDLRQLLLPEGFEGHPLRKDFVLASRIAKAWPGAKEPGESDHGAPSRRRMLPPGVPTDWGAREETRREETPQGEPRREEGGGDG